MPTATSRLEAPLRFFPYLRPMVWGGRRLGDVLGKPLPTADNYGESWDVSDHPHHRSVVATGPRVGQTLRQLMETERADLLGPAAASHPTFPWLVKFLDCNDWLSVQVHPPEDAVQRLWPGEGSKTEAWFVLDVAPGSRIYAGLLPGTDEARLRQALQAGTVADCLHQFEPRPGDCVFLPAGTVHAVGGGVLMAEVQQTSDATFRLFDWNRRDAHGKTRTLHVEEALACIDWTAGPVRPHHAEAFRNPDVSGGPDRQPLVECRYFTMEHLRLRQPFTFAGTGQMGLVVVLKGRGRMRTADGEEALEPGQAWVLPASLAPAVCRPEMALCLLHCTLPGAAA
jgi:mannose-6-phosphate isomerase